MEKYKVKTNKGITLIALVITIIVLLILAGVTIAMLTGNNGILTKVKDICGYNCMEYYVISDDPDCDVDFGVDEKGFLIIESKISNLKVSDLKQIRYRVGPYLEENSDKEYYISFVFNNDLTLYFYITDCGFLKGIVIGDKKFCSDSDIIVEGIIFNPEYNWKDTMVIKDKELVAYLGHEKHVIIPDGVEVIGVDAFEKCSVKSVILPSTTIIIKRRAFWFNSLLDRIELCSVESIEEEAFGYCKNLKEIIIPESVKEIQKNAFCNSGLTLEKIENYSDIEINDNILNK